MIVVHFESGLGNQMLDYVDYLAYKYYNPNQKCYIENIVFSMKDSKKVIDFWNGYELDKVFGINALGMSEFLGELYPKFYDSFLESEFWNNNWSYPQAFSEAMKVCGYEVENHCSGGKVPPIWSLNSLSAKQRIKYENPVGNKLFVLYKTMSLPFVREKMEKRIVAEHKPVNYRLNSNGKVQYVGHNLEYMYKNNGIEHLDGEVAKHFIFPDFESGSKNESLVSLLKDRRSVAIHARRGDFLGCNYPYYKNGYFERSLSYIRKADNPEVFLIFCDSGSVEWCKNNYQTLGLKKTDEVIFVDWNIGNDSYRDMQLISLCNHGVVTSSSFGWWGTFLNKNPDKITCSPHPAIRTTHWF